MTRDVSRKAALRDPTRRDVTRRDARRRAEARHDATRRDTIRSGGRKMLRVWAEGANWPFSHPLRASIPQSERAPKEAEAVPLELKDSARRVPAPGWAAERRG